VLLERIAEFELRVTRAQHLGSQRRRDLVELLDQYQTLRKDKPWAANQSFSADLSAPDVRSFLPHLNHETLDALKPAFKLAPNPRDQVRRRENVQHEDDAVFRSR